MKADTIGAISTPSGESGIAVIRVSGSLAIESVDTIFQSRTKLTDANTHTVHYGYIIDPDRLERIEEVLVTIMREPRSFTKENIVEISCHGGIIPVQQVLKLLLKQGVRLAEPGEFTKRAYLNGRIDLSQAEAVIDIIRAKSDRAYKIAMKQAEGSLSTQIKLLRQVLIELMAHIEVNIDYPEHDVESLTSLFIQEKCQLAITHIEQLLHHAAQGRILREGITTAIIGRPNVGKSSLLNILTHDNRAIVTDIPGTTRDVIEEFVTLNGIPLRLMDTAGLRDTTDLVEQLGVEKSKKALEEADLILLMINQAEPLFEQDIILLEQLHNRATIVILNKSDKPSVVDLAKVYKLYPSERVVPMSITENIGVAQLESAVSSIFLAGELEMDDPTYVSNIRHIHLLQKSKANLREAFDAVDLHVPIDMIQIDIRSAWETLGEIVGDTITESLIDQIFSQFCLGK